MNTPLFLEKNRTLFYKLSVIFGGALIFIAGMLFVLLADLELKVRSSWLFLVIIFSIGSAVAMFLSDKLEEKRKWLISVKVIAVVCAIALIVILPVFMNAALTSTVKANSDEFNRDLFALATIFKTEVKEQVKVISIIPMIIAILAALVQIFNLVLAVLKKND